MAEPPYDAVLLVSFGGPEGRDEVMPFLENVLRGRNVPRERMLEVAEHYYRFDGVSPINEQNRQLMAALQARLAADGPNLPVYWGNRNWNPLLADTLRGMRDDGIKRALAFVTSAYSSFSGCRQYRGNIADAQAAVGSGAPAVDKIRAFFNHPGFIGPMAERVAEALAKIPAERREAADLIFTAHSVPLQMANSSQYVPQLNEACRLVGEAVGRSDYRLVWQSRSGPPTQPWLEPDICDHLRARREQGVRDAVVAPIGFISDHMEVLFDLDTEARQVASEVGLNFVRAGTAGTHPGFIAMIRELILERTAPESTPRRALGGLGPSRDFCPDDCCPAPERPARPSPARA
jgi:ferrochelatase